MYIDLLMSKAVEKGLLKSDEEINPERAFLLVRDMPYTQASSRDPETIIQEWRGTCSGKHYLLKQLFAELGCSSQVIACTTVAQIDPQEVRGKLRALLQQSNSRFVDVHNYLLLDLPKGQMIVDATWPISTDGMGTVVNKTFVLGEDQQVACEPIQTWEVPEDQDPQAFKEQILRQSFTDEELEHREEFIKTLGKMTQFIHQPIQLTAGKVFQLTPDFLNSVLEPFNNSNHVAIIDIRQEQLTGDTKFNAILLRLHLTYARPTIAPQTLIAKLPTIRTELHERAQVFQPGSRENWFYQSGASHSPMHVPRCFLNGIGCSTGESVLLLEDLEPATPGSWLVGATLGQAKLALDSLARLHAHWWGQDSSKEIQELNQMLSGNWDGEQNLVQELYDSAWPKFVSQMGAALPNDIRRFGEALVGNMKMVDDLSDLGPRTLVHGDYRLDNILFGEKNGESICWVVDWEDVFFGSGMIDVTWFLGGCLPVEHSQHESDLLRFYYDVLLDEGVEDYTWDQCYEGYRRNMCSSFVQGVLSATLDEGASEYDQQLSHMIAERFTAAAQRLQLLAFIYS